MIDIEIDTQHSAARISSAKDLPNDAHDTARARGPRQNGARANRLVIVLWKRPETDRTIACLGV